MSHSECAPGQEIRAAERLPTGVGLLFVHRAYRERMILCIRTCEARAVRAWTSGRRHFGVAILRAMADVAEIAKMIEDALPGATVEVVDQGGGDHLAATVIAPQFANASRIEQHRMVYAAVQPRLDDGAIHALALKTRAPEDT